jgi:hypothetical protein
MTTSAKIADRSGGQDDDGQAKQGMHLGRETELLCGVGCRPECGGSHTRPVQSHSYLYIISFFGLPRLDGFAAWLGTWCLDEELRENERKDVCCEMRDEIL